MKLFRLSALFVLFVAVSAVSAVAQTAGAAPTKIGVVNTNKFDDATKGIKKYTGGLNAVEAEMKPISTDLQNLATRGQNLQKEIEALQKTPANVPVPQDALTAKMEELDKLNREYKYKQESAKAQYERVYARIMGPIQEEIGTALQEFSKKNGFAVIFDLAKLGESGAILALDDRADTTEEFIAFFNTRPATTAPTTPAKPK